MTAGHERELGGGEEPVADDELVGRPGPGCGRGPIDMDTGATGGNEDDAALAGGDQGRRIEEGGDAHLARPPGARPEAQLEGDLRAVRADDTVDLVAVRCRRRPAPRAPHQGDGRRVVVRQGAGLHRVVDAGDGHTGKRMGRLAVTDGSRSALSCTAPDSRTEWSGRGRDPRDGGLACAGTGRDGCTVRAGGRGVGKIVDLCIGVRQARHRRSGVCIDRALTALVLALPLASGAAPLPVPRPRPRGRRHRLVTLPERVGLPRAGPFGSRWTIPIPPVDRSTWP